MYAEGSVMRRRGALCKKFWTGIAMLLVVVMVAVVGPCISGYTYEEQNLQMVNNPPSTAYWFGTDALGRDVFTRVCYGARISLSIGIFTAFISLILGIVYGGMSGYLGGRVDEILMRFVDVLLGIPFVLYAILLVVLLEPGLIAVVVAMGSVCWLTMARIVRGEVLSVKGYDYVMAARAVGAGTWRVLLGHIMPNIMGPVLVTAVFTVPDAIFTEAFLSFLGLGVAHPVPSWGVLVAEGLSGLRNYPWQVFFPILFIVITLTALNLIGEGLRDYYSP